MSNLILSYFETKAKGQVRNAEKTSMLKSLGLNRVQAKKKKKGAVLVY